MKTKLPDRIQGLSLTSPFLRLGIVAVFSATMALAQETAPAPEASAETVAEEEEETILLNPFEITEEKNTWNATETLAGSRLKSDLSDVASQVEVMTMDFMDAFNLNSIEEAAIYSLNVESPQENTGVGISGQGNDDLRIRGISSATRSREFFRTNIPTDNYNLTRVSIASGPNAILFGTGSPAGTIDSSISRAQVGNNFGEVRFQVDDWGGYRAQIDYNYALVENKLALRVAALTHKRGFDEDDAFIQNDRIYGALTWKPFPRTTISAHGEWAMIDSQRPTRQAPIDEVSTWYNSAGLLNQSGLVDAENPIIPNQTLFDNSPAWQDGDPDNGIGSRAFTRNQDALLQTAGNNITLLGGPQSGALASARSWWGSVHSDKVSPNDALSIFEGVNRDSNGTTLLTDDLVPRDFHTLKNLMSQEDDAKILNLFFNQEIVDRLFFDFGYHYEEVEEFNPSSLQFTQGYIIEVDSNRYLPGEGNGMVENPMAGQMYVDGEPEYSRGEAKIEEWRAALSYELDVRDWTDNKWFNWLGRHRVAGMYLDRTGESMSQLYKYSLQPQMIDGIFQDGVFPGFNYNDLDTRVAIAGLGVPGVDNDTQSSGYEVDDRQFTIRSYMGTPGNITYPELPNGFVPGQAFTITDANGTAFTIDPEYQFTGDNGQRLTVGNAPNGTRQTLQTYQISWQGFFWDDRIVATYGWREDTLNTVEEDNSQINPTWTHPETGQVFNASDVRLRAPFQDTPWQEVDPEAEATGNTTLMGIVIHPFRNWDAFQLPAGMDISFSYSESDTFQPNTNERNPDGTLIPGEEGEGEDYGFRFSLWNNKLSLRYNHYETMAGPTKLFLPFRRWRFRWREGGSMRDVITMLAGADKAIFDSYFPNPEDWPLRATVPGADVDKIYPFFARDGGFATGDFDNYADPYTFTAVSEAVGDEISIAWEPDNNWSFRATWNNQEVIQSQLGALWFQFTDEYQAIMDRTRFIEGYVPGVVGLSGWDNPNGVDMDGLDRDPNDGLPPGIDYFGWDEIPYGGNGNGRPIVTSGAWGQHDGAVEGGWTRQTMKERHIDRIVNSNNGTAVLEAFDGKPNDFLRENRVNINAQYRFTEGALNGLRIGGAYRYRKGAGIAIGTQIVNGEEVPDTDIVIIGPSASFFDLTFDYRGRSDFFGLFGGNKGYNVGLTVRNIFDQGPFEPESVDANTLQTTNYLRVDGRQIILSAGLQF